MQSALTVRAMETRQAIAHFGSVAALARALGITSQAVYQWGAEVPPRRAFELERITSGALRAPLVAKDSAA